MYPSAHAPAGVAGAWHSARKGDGVQGLGSARPTRIFGREPTQNAAYERLFAVQLPEMLPIAGAHTLRSMIQLSDA